MLAIRTILQGICWEWRTQGALNHWSVSQSRAVHWAQVHTSDSCTRKHPKQTNQDKLNFVGLFHWSCLCSIFHAPTTLFLLLASEGFGHWSIYKRSKPPPEGLNLTANQKLQVTGDDNKLLFLRITFLVLEDILLEIFSTFWDKQVWTQKPHESGNA